MKMCLTLYIYWSKLNPQNNQLNTHIIYMCISSQYWTYIRLFIIFFVFHIKYEYEIHYREISIIDYEVQARNWMDIDIELHSSLNVLYIYLISKKLYLLSIHKLHYSPNLYLLFRLCLIQFQKCNGIDWLHIEV